MGREEWGGIGEEDRGGEVWGGGGRECDKVMTLPQFKNYSNDATCKPHPHTLCCGHQTLCSDLLSISLICHLCS